MISLPTLNGVIEAAKTLLVSALVIAIILLIGEIIYRLEERKKNGKRRND